MKDQALVEGFLREFVERLTARYGDRIEFILLFGSAARGDWIRGASDIDLIIQLRQPGKKEVAEYATGLFWELDARHGTAFREVCSLGQEDLLSAVERRARLYCPFEVLEPGVVDWGRGEFHDPFFRAALFLVAPKGMILRKIKLKGKVLWGRDAREEIPLGVSVWDGMKALAVPHWPSTLPWWSSSPLPGAPGWSPRPSSTKQKSSLFLRGAHRAWYEEGRK